MKISVTYMIVKALLENHLLDFRYSELVHKLQKYEIRGVITAEERKDLLILAEYKSLF